MPNIAAVLKTEITRLARKHTRIETDALRRAVTHHRAEIAALKRRLLQLEQQLRRTARNGAAPPRDGAPAAGATKLRYSAKGFAAQRRRLALSAHEVGLLLGVADQTVYNWEAGASRPRASHLPAIAALRKLGKRQAQALLAQRRAA
jgi:DNA-binding XRE family transcriptional regulator